MIISEALEEKIKKLFIYLTIITIWSCSSNKLVITNSVGDASMQKNNHSFTGISKISNDEQESRKDALQNALSQISIFNGVGVLSELKLNKLSIENNGNLIHQETIDKKVSIFSKSFLKIFKTDYYTETYKIKNETKYKTWCYIPYNEQMKEKFLQELITGYKREIQFVENNLSSKNINQYLENLKQTIEFYFNLKQNYEKSFSIPNSFTIFLNEKVNILKSKIDNFYTNLECSIADENVNSLEISFFHKNKAVLLESKIKEINAISMIDTFKISSRKQKTICKFRPTRSGKTGIRILPEYSKFNKYATVKHFDKTISLKLKNKFVDKKIGIAIYDIQNNNFLANAAGSLGKIITILEGSSLNINSSSEEKIIEYAKNENCDFVIIGKAEILDNKFNPNQNMFIVFPSIHLKILDLKTDEIIFQNSYPDNIIKDIRGLGKSEEQAIKNGLTFDRLFKNSTFFEEMNKL